MIFEGFSLDRLNMKQYLNIAQLMSYFYAKLANKLREFIKFTELRSSI